MREKKNAAVAKKVAKSKTPAQKELKRLQNGIRHQNKVKRRNKGGCNNTSGDISTKTSLFSPSRMSSCSRIAVACTEVPRDKNILTMQSREGQSYKRKIGDVVHPNIYLDHNDMSGSSAHILTATKEIANAYASSKIIESNGCSKAVPAVRHGDCKASNKMCSIKAKTSSSLIHATCYICCTEPNFCQYCCCILCSKTIDWIYEGYNFIKCEGTVDEKFICGHVAHIECALRAYMAGKVGGSIDLDAQYYCRCCDNKTDLLLHVDKIIKVCESIDNRDDKEKVLNLGLCMLHGSEKQKAKKLQNLIAMLIEKKMPRATKKKKLTCKQNEIEGPKAAFKESNALDEHVEPCNSEHMMEDNNVQSEDNPQAFENNAMQAEGNFEGNDARIEDNPHAFEDNAMQHEEDSEATIENESPLQDVNSNPVKIKYTRGPTKIKMLPSDSVDRIEVEFNAEAEPIGAGSVNLSSYLGPLVRKHVPVTFTDWRHLSDDLKVVLWESIRARFKLDEDWQKVSIFRQMGRIWRSSKCRLVRQIVNAKTKKEMLQLKPNNIKSMKEWKKFIKSKTSSNFKTQSEKFKAIRSNQMPHTCGRRGMARLAADLEKRSADPSSVSRFQVWIESLTRKNGEPVSMAAADTIEKIKKFENESQVLGQDGPGQLRGMKRGISFTKFILSQATDKQETQFQSRIAKLEEMVRVLMKNQGKKSLRDESTSQTNKYEKTSDKCDLLDWSGIDEIVAEGRVVSSDPKEFVHKIPLGPNAMKILIDLPRKLDAFLWRPISSMTRIGEAEDEIVAWPANRVVLRTIENFDKGDNVSKTSSTNIKCKMYDWGGSEELVAEGRLYSCDPNQLVNDIPLGPSAVIVSIDNPKKLNAFLWRPTAGMTYVREAVGNKVAWPKSNVVVEKIKGVGSKVAWSKSDVIVEKINNSASHTRTINALLSHTNANSMSKSKCRLIDVCGTGKIVAEGRVSSTDPTVLVHFVPLGENAVKVWVDIAKVPNALLWRSSSEFKCIEDVVGSTIAWPAANVVIESTSSNY